jgi:DNA-binding transcriptional regulator YdaS (Cro superfamily)
VKLYVKPQRILDFDLENRPLNYVGQDFTFSEITAIAWKFIGEPGPIEALCLGEPIGNPPYGVPLPFRTMLLGFMAAYIEADLVTGHNIIKHDLRILNGALLEEGLSPLPPKMVCDTYLHLKRKGGVSGSQESLAAMLGVRAPKVGMSQADWREANRLTPAGIALTRKRVTADVRQHIQLRKELLKRDWLHPARVWHP